MNSIISAGSGLALRQLQNRILFTLPSANSQLSKRSFTNATSTQESAGLKSVLAQKIIEHQKKVKEFRVNHGNKVIGEITVDQAYGGMRGLKTLVTETSYLDPEEGIAFRGYSIPQIRKMLPCAPDGQEPLPEGLLWLLLTGEIPTKEQVQLVSRELAQHADLSSHVVTMLNNLPSNTHPMSQFSAAITIANTESLFAKAYAQGVPKSVHWEYVYEDSIRLIAKLPTIAATIYKNLYRDGSSIGAISSNKDWSANFTSMLGYDNNKFTELMRLYLTIHSDHEGGNVSAHTAHLVGSALSDPYLSFAAGMNGLAGPLHGLANQEVLIFLKKLQKELGNDFDENKLREFILNYLKSGQVVPGYGHAVLRKTDPRYTAQHEFALKHLPDDNLFKLVSALYKVVPPILADLGKVKNPWPNVDAHSGILLNHYGMTEMNFYTVLFGISRALGICSSLVWDRALGLPIEHPKSITTEQAITYATNVKHSASKLAEQLIIDIKKELKSERTELEEIATYYFDGQGKAYRPMIVILIGRAYNRHLGQNIELSEAQKVVAMVAEMIHTSSLVHDDVIDSADTRRGKPSVNVLYGQRKSILAGDYILSRASQMLARLGNKDILVVLSHILLDLVRGEFMQMSTKPGENKRFDHYISKSFKKTASLIAYTCKAVTLLSGADEKQQEAAFEYGRNLGIAFQLVDDLLDFESSQSELGKPTAADLKLGLATAPVLYASAQFQELDAMIARRFSEPGDVEKAYAFVMSSEGLEKTRELAKKHVDDALEHISHLTDSEEKRALISLAEMTIKRKK